MRQSAFFCLAMLTVGSPLAVVGESALAQSQGIVPDGTLGAESSTVRTVAPQVDLIEGGALRGVMLFHSFEEFNIAEGGGAYFSNPDVVNTIFSRVTGANPSNIFGTLGVLGNADLVFLNPNGILFGPNAQLNLQGAFTASTASGVEFPNGEVFSALEPEEPSLLTMNVEAPIGLVFEGASSESIVNEGILAIAEDLTLSADSLDLQGQLYAGRDLTLQAQDSIRIRDSEQSPFIAVAGEQLTVQGNQEVDIFALNHPNSGLFSGGDMILRSAEQVGGDAHYFSGGVFRVEQLDNSLGTLVSPHDPIIQTRGGVAFDSYLGASLHIFSGGSVVVPGGIVIAITESVANSIQESIKLSDNETVVDINGSEELTLDVRAGMSDVVLPDTPNILGNLNFFSPVSPEINQPSSGSDIRIGSITIFGPRCSPVVFSLQTNIKLIITYRMEI